MHAEDNFVRSESAFESHYFHSMGKAEITVPVGRVLVEVTKGFEYQVARETVICGPHAQVGHPSEAAADSHGPALAVGQCRSARTHELWRGLPQHADESCGTGGCGESLSCRESGGQQRAADTRHRLLQDHARPGFNAEPLAAARPGVSHQLLGSPGTAESDS